MPPFLTVKNRKLKIKLTPLVENADEASSLSAASSAAAGTLSVQNINKFAINQILLIGELGGEQSEFVKTHASSAPSGSTVTLAANTVYAHPAGTRVYIVQYDQVELTHATSITGTKTPLVTTIGFGLVSLEADELEMVYDEKEYSSGYYFARFCSSITATFTAATDDDITASAHGLQNGELLKLTSSGTLPAGLATYVLYYVVDKATNTFNVSLSEDGADVDITDTGTGTHSFRRSGIFSDAVPYTGFVENTVANAIAHALSRSGVKEFNNEITRQFCYEEITDMFRYVQGMQKRWNKYQSLNTAIGTTARGTRVVSMPSDIYDANSNRSLTGVRIGENRALFYQDPDEFEDLLEGEKTTTANGEVAVGATTMILTDSDDFEDNGTITVYISGTKYDITYTAITRSTHTLTGIPASGTGSVTAIIPTGTNVWQDNTEGEPLYYTVRNGNIEFMPMPSDLWDNRNIFADYWTEATAVDSDSDTLDVERYDMAKYWLTWKMRMMSKNEGKLDYEDGDYKMFADRVKGAIVFKGSLMKHKMMPRVNGISHRGYGRTRRRLTGE